MFQRMGKPHQENRQTQRWLPLPADPTPRAEKDSELPKHLTVAEQIPTKRPRDADLLPRKKYEQDGILKRRHGFSQVDIHPQSYCFCPGSMNSTNPTVNIWNPWIGPGLKPVFMTESENFFKNAITNEMSTKTSIRLQRQLRAKIPEGWASSQLLGCPPPPFSPTWLSTWEVSEQIADFRCTSISIKALCH